MNLIEDRLRKALDGAAETVQQNDLSPLVTPRQARRSRRWLALVAVAAAAVTVATLQLWPVSADNALASWTPVAKATDSTTERELSTMCQRPFERSRIRDGKPRQTSPPRVLLVDRRGANAVTLLVSKEGIVTQCGFLGLARTPAGRLEARGGGGGLQSGTPAQPLGDKLLTVEGIPGTANEDGGIGIAFGQVAANAAKVVADLDDGAEVQATVKGGWYLAWWPERIKRGVLIEWEADRREIEAVRAYDASGKLLEELRHPTGALDPKPLPRR